MGIIPNTLTLAVIASRSYLFLATRRSQISNNLTFLLTHTSTEHQVVALQQANDLLLKFQPLSSLISPSFVYYSSLGLTRPRLAELSPIFWVRLAFYWAKKKKTKKQKTKQNKKNKTMTELGHVGLDWPNRFATQPNLAWVYLFNFGPWACYVKKTVGA